MNPSDQVWVGADPGGEENFGVAILASDGTVRTWCVDCADEAVAIVRENVYSQTLGAGVDAPLWWSSGRSSDRKADQWLRCTYKVSGRQVQTGNSLRGAALIQGMMFVNRLHEIFPAIPITEAHPNIALKALHLDGASFCNRFRVSNVTAEISMNSMP